MASSASPKEVARGVDRPESLGGMISAFGACVSTTGVVFTYPLYMKKNQQQTKAEYNIAQTTRKKKQNDLVRFIRKSPE
jgi:hypothetical protein